MTLATEVQRRAAAQAEGVEIDFTNVDRWFPVDAAYAYGQVMNAGTTVIGKWNYRHRWERVEQVCDWDTDVRSPDSGPAVQPYHHIPASIAGEVATGAEQSVLTVLPSAELEYPDLRMKQRAGAGRKDGVRHRLQKRDQIGCRAGRNDLAGLREDVDSVGRAAHRIEDRDRIVGLSNMVSGKGQRDGEGAREVERERRTHSVN
jgi:hypothetical protein